PRHPRSTPFPYTTLFRSAGEPVQITDDPRNKYGLAFSPDGSQVAYTIFENGSNSQWQTFTVPLPGGKPRLLFANAAGLTWLDEHRLLYSEIRTGLHMGIVTSGLNRTDTVRFTSRNMIAAWPITLTLRRTANGCCSPKWTRIGFPAASSHSTAAREAGPSAPTVHARLRPG